MRVLYSIGFIRLGGLDPATVVMVAYLYGGPLPALIAGWACRPAIARWRST